MTTNSHLQLCVNDLLHPTEKSESLLEALTSSQLEEIEKTLSKIKTKKQTTQNVTTSNQIPMSQTANPSALHHDWALVAAQIAKTLADSITTAANTSSSNNKNNVKSASNNAKPPVSSPLTTGTTSVKSPVASTTSISSTSSKSPTNTNNTPTSPSSNTPANPASSSTAAAAAGSVVPNHEPRTEIREGVEWVSFVYSHHRVLRRYSIRTDVDQVDLDVLDDKFKSENCVYPRANLPRDEYKGNRWAYETECNTLGWKLAHLNSTEIAGKRGLIQRAVDSYRNRYPSMRSRRVARQEKLLKGTLRKRKQRESEELLEDEERAVKSVKNDIDTNSADTASSTSTVTTATPANTEFPKTVTIDDGVGGSKNRIRINVETVSLDAIDVQFRKANCVYPRAMEINTLSPFASQRQIEEAKCNELGWKLAWLNPKQLANRKNLLQRVLDVYRSKFLPELNPRKNSLRMTSPPNRLSIDTDMLTAKTETVASSTPLTVAALAAQQQELTTAKVVRRGGRGDKNDDDESLYSGTTDSLDFHDCFSPPEDATTSSPSLYLDTTKVESCNSPSTSDSSMLLSPNASINELMLSIPTTSDDLLFGSSQHPLFVETGHDSCRLSISSGSSGGSDLAASPYIKTEQLDETLFKDTAMFELYAEPIQLPSAGVDFEQCDYIKAEDDHLMDPLMSQLFHI